MKLYKRVPLWAKILIGLFAGLILGIIFGEKALYLKSVGDIFVNAIKMLIVPLIFSSLIVGVTSVDDVGKMGRIGLKTIVTYFITTIFAICIGFLISSLTGLGQGVKMSVSEPAGTINTVKHASIGVADIIPKNPIAAMANGDIIPIIVFAILVGVSINIAGKKADPVKNFMNGLAEVMYKMTAIVMEFAPYGVAALMACVIGDKGIAFLLPLLKVVAVVYIACLVHALVVYSGILAFVCRLSPVRFFKGFLDAIVLSFSLSSSSGTLPVSMTCAQEKLGVSEGISSFVLPLGATINMNGTAIYQGVCAVFIAHVYGIELSLGTYVTITLTSIMAAVGTAGIPGAGLIMLGLVLKSAGLPIEGFALVAGIDRLLDMARSCINVMGDGLATVIVAKSEKEFDVNIYNAKN
ncbi:MAG: dicarboxylate/amino acid:cation symporter [Victivallales bacterium]|nr:dicarboxylate/amino acid:cation symporter [Victivallales bacterium]